MIVTISMLFWNDNKRGVFLYGINCLFIFLTLIVSDYIVETVSVAAIFTDIEFGVRRYHNRIIFTWFQYDCSTINLVVIFVYPFAISNIRILTMIYFIRSWHRDFFYTLFGGKSASRFNRHIPFAQQNRGMARNTLYLLFWISWIVFAIIPRTTITLANIRSIIIHPSVEEGFFNVPACIHFIVGNNLLARSIFGYCHL